MKTTIALALVLVSIISPAQTLEDYTKIAAEQNPGLQAKYREFEMATQKVAQVSTLPDPTFSVSAFGQMIETRVGPQRARFTLSQMFPWFGTLKAQGNAATLMAEANFQAYLNERNMLELKVASAYYPLYEIYRWKKLEQENIAILKSYKTITTTKFENGAGPMVDVLRVDIMLNEAETNLSILKDKERSLLITFNTLLNREELAVVVMPDSLPAGTLPQALTKDSLMVTNPALESFALKMEAGKASERAAVKQASPRLGVGLDYIIIGERTDLGPDMAPPPDNGKDAIMPMVTVTLPIYRGKYKAAIKETQLASENYRLQREEYTNSLLAGYEMAQFEAKKEFDLITLYGRQREETNQALNLLLSAYGNSGKDFEEVLRMQQQLLKYDKMKASAEVQFHIAVARMNYLTGKSYGNESK